MSVQRLSDLSGCYFILPHRLAKMWENQTFGLNIFYFKRKGITNKHNAYEWLFGGDIRMFYNNSLKIVYRYCHNRY